MEKAIEKMWKEGFMTSGALKAPKIDNLDSLQSIYFIDQFKMKYKRNVIALTLTAVVILLAFIVGGIPIIGFYMFLLFTILGVIGQIELNKLEQINLGASNYEFLEKFDRWLKNLLSKFSMIYRIWTPLLFIGFALALLKTKFFIPFFGKTLSELISNPQTGFNLGGVPVFWLTGIILIAMVLSYFSDILFKREMRSIYGDLLGRIEQLLVEIKELS